MGDMSRFRRGARDLAVRCVGGADRLALVRVLPQASPRLTAAASAITVVTALIPVAITVASGVLVGSLAAGVRDGWDSPAGRRLLIAVIVVGSLYVVQQTLHPILNAVAGSLGRRVNGLLREHVMTASMSPVGIGHLEDPTTLDRVALAREVGVGGFTPGAAAAATFNFMVFRLIGFGQAVIVATFHWWLAVALVVVTLFNRRPVLGQIMRTLQVVVGRARALRRADYVRDLALAPAAAKETRVFGLGGWLLDRYRRDANTAMDEVWRERATQRWDIFPSLLLLAVVNVAAMVVTIDGFLDGQLSLGRFTAILQAIIGVSALTNLSNEDVQMAHGVSAVPAVGDLERAAARSELHIGGTASPEGMPTEGIAFEGVSFRYPGTDHDIYRRLDLDIPAGRSLAIVGVNGAGKTTLVKLLARLYEPTEGRITVDGVDVRELDAQGWQRRVAAIFQDFLRYELSVADNIGLGAVDRIDDHEMFARSRASEQAPSRLSTV